jgi:hypothetical protein
MEESAHGLQLFLWTTSFEIKGGQAMRIFSIVCCAGIAALFAGCNETADRPATRTDSTTHVSEEHTVAEKQEFERELEEDLETIDEKMARLGERIKEAEGDVRARLQQEWDELEPQRQRARQRLQEVKSSSAEAWQDLKAGARSAFDDLRDAVNKASERFEDET